MTSYDNSDEIEEVDYDDESDIDEEVPIEQPRTRSAAHHKTDADVHREDASARLARQQAMMGMSDELVEREMKQSLYVLDGIRQRQQRLQDDLHAVDCKYEWNGPMHQLYKELLEDARQVNNAFLDYKNEWARRRMQQSGNQADPVSESAASFLPKPPHPKLLKAFGMTPQ